MTATFTPTQSFPQTLEQVPDENGSLEAARSLAVERFFRTWDGTELFYRIWHPPRPARNVLLLLHRGHEHSGRYEALVRELDLPETLVAAWDVRGHGRSPGERGYADDFATVVRDLDAFARHMSGTHGIALEDTAVLGHSVAAVAAAAWVHDYAPPLRAMVLATPAFAVKLYVPLARPALRAGRALGTAAFVKSYVRPGMLTHDAAQAAAYDADPLISRQIATNVLLDLHDTSRRLLDDAAAIRVPMLVLGAGSDWVVKNGPQRAFFERLSSPVKEMEVYQGFHHSIFHERDRHLPTARARRFLLESFDRPRRPAPAAPTDDAATAYDRLRAPLPAVSPRRWNFAAQRVVLKTVGRLSQGLRTGWAHGFDSGESLDHVYRDRAAGLTPLGRLIDRVYLNAVGWRGIRQRKVHLQQALRDAIGRRRGSGRPVRVVDVASGPGRYLLEVLKDLPAADVPHVSALLRDRSPTGLAAARRLAAEWGLTNVEFAEGDAFDRDSLAAVRPHPDVAVVSGLYELVDDNERVLTSLRGLYDALNEGGSLIYTNQPWHPQLEMIARVLTNRDGAPWVMRCRPQGEMDGLVRAAGFEKVGTVIDRSGIFTVSVAVKPNVKLDTAPAAG